MTAAVHIIQTGVANTASVAAAVERLGLRAVLTADPECAASAGLLILPGVGSFASGMAALETRGLAQPLRERIGAGLPTLAICLGMQMLFEYSEECPGARGLAVLPGVVRRFPGGVRVPQLGWNRIGSDQSCAILRPGAAYFANSYRVERIPPGWSGAVADHGGPFAAAIERGAVLACQFHPELSGPWGRELLARWLAAAGSAKEASLC